MWFTITTLDSHAGYVTIPTSLARGDTLTPAEAKQDEVTWGYCRIRLDYHSGGYLIATIPKWLHGKLSMPDYRSAGRVYHRHWNDLVERGLIEVHKFVGAAEEREGQLLATDAYNERHGFNSQ